MNLKKSVVGIMLLILVCLVEGFAVVKVRDYFRKNGTYVSSHYRSNSDGYFYNNWSTYPNVNPYTGKTGTLRYPKYRTYRK